MTAATGSPTWRTVPRASAQRGGSAIGLPSARADRPERRHRADAVGRHVGAGEHGDDAGQRAAPPRHRCVRMRACACGERTSTQCNSPGSVDVGDEAARGRAETARSSTRRTDAPMPSCARLSSRGVRYCSSSRSRSRRSNADLVGDDEQVGVAVLRRVAREGPMRDR